MIEIVNLGAQPRYFKVFFSEIFREFQSFFKGLTRETVKENYWANKNNIYIALDNKKFIGCYSVHGCLIGDVYVNSLYRGKGIGRLLIEDAKKRTWYCLRWTLTTATKNVGFYEHQGFRIQSSRKDGHDMVCYNKSAFILLASVIITAMICVLFF